MVQDYHLCTEQSGDETIIVALLEQALVEVTGWEHKTNSAQSLRLTSEQGDREGAPIHMPMIRLETVENHRKYCLMPSTIL